MSVPCGGAVCVYVGSEREASVGVWSGVLAGVRPVPCASVCVPVSVR